MPARAKESPAPAKDEPPFEAALAELETIVREMEGEQVPLDKLIENYERGSALYRRCQERLDAAEGRIETIRNEGPANTGGESKDRDAESQEEAAAPSASEHGDELF